MFTTLAAEPVHGGDDGLYGALADFARSVREPLEGGGALLRLRAGGAVNTGATGVIDRAEDAVVVIARGSQERVVVSLPSLFE